MTFTPEKLKTARDYGYTDDEIWDFLGKDDKRFNTAKENGYSLDETISVFASGPQSTQPAEPARRAGGGVVGGAADIGVQFMKGLGTGTRMISDVFGANNPVSQAIAGYEDYFDDLLSAESKKDSQKISSILKDAEGKGILPQIMAGLEAFTVAPAEMTASTLGMMLPNLAGGVYAKAAQLTKAGVIGLQIGIGAAQGAGSVKGQIYTAVQEELRQQGLPEDQIDKVATEAQAYGGKNLDQILLGAGLGAAASSTGAEKIMTRLITGAGKEATEDVIKAVIKGGLSEAPLEALQGGQEQVAQNVALQRIGVDVPTMQGVIPAATMEATAGLLVGGAFGGIEATVSPEDDAERRIDKKSDQQSNEFLAPNNPTSQAVVKELARRENAVTNLQQAYDALEPNSQEAQRLKLELSEAQKNLSAFKDTANKEGLSLPITDAEAEQARLAREIAAPPAEPAPPITPAPTKQEGANEMNLEEISESAIAAFPDMMEADGGLLPLTRFTPEEQASLRKAGIVETATTSKGETYEGVNAEYLWQRRNQLQQERAAKLKQAPAEPAAEAVVPTAPAPPVVEAAPVSETITEPAPVTTPAPAEVVTPAGIKTTPKSKGKGVRKIAAETRSVEDQISFNIAADYLDFAETEASKNRTPQKITGNEQELVRNLQLQLSEKVRNKETGEPDTTHPAYQQWKILQTKAGRERIANGIKNNAIRIIRSSPEKYSNFVKVMRGEPAEIRKMAIEQETAKELRVEEDAQVVPVENRYTFEETGIRSIQFFGGKAPDGLIILEDTTNPNYKMKAGYDPETGEIILNRAYIKKGDSIEDILTHELGHYIFSDPKFQADFKNFLDSMPDDTRAQIEAIINESYNKETNETQIEERQVMAFTALVKASKDTLSAWENLKNTIKRWINRVLGTNIKLSDEGAMAVFNVGFKRFKSGEKIVRAMSEGKLKMAAEPRKPAAEEKPTEEEAEPKRKTVAALPYGGIVTTPIGINKKTETIVQKQVFNGDVAPSPEKTTEAYDIIEKLLDPKTKGQYADEINELTRAQMSVDEKRQVDETIGAVKLGNELFKYAVNLAAKGDLRMLQLLFEKANDLAVSGVSTVTESGRTLQARANLASWVRRAAEAQKKGVVNSIALQIYGPGVTKEQMDSIIEALNQMNKVKTAEAEQVYDDLETTGEKLGVDIRGAVEKAIRKADPTTRDPWVMALEILKAIEEFQSFTYQKVKGATKKTIQNLVAGTPFAKNLANYQKKMIDTGASGLNTLFWKTLSDQQQRMGRLAEVDMAVNRNLAGIVRDTLVRLGLKGEPGKGQEGKEQEEEYKKMTVFEQVANILAANEAVAAPREGEFVTKAVPLSQAKMLEADRMIIEEINRREAKAIEDAGDNAEMVEIAEAEANALRQAWDEAMSRQLDIPISDATLRRLIFAQLKQSESSMRELSDAIVNDKVIGGARKEGLLTSIIQQLDGLTKEGDTKRDYTKLREALSAQLDQMVENTILKKRMNSALRKVAKESNPDKQAERQIEKLADLQSDVQSWPKTREDKVRDIVREDLQQKLDLGLKVRDKIRAAWKGVLRQKLIDAGVKPDTAERLTDIVWRQHEINYLNRKMKDVEMAVTRGPIAPIVNAIKNTPLSQQQDPKWKRKVAYEYLVNAGLDKDTAGRVADLMDLTLQKVFVRAQEKAFNDIVGRKLNTPNSRRQMQRFLQAIRAGALDPTKNLTSEIAAQNGWTGFTSEQVAKLNELDAIVNDPKALDLQRSTAFNEIQNILKVSKLDPTVMETLSAYYTAQALSGIPTTTVNIFSAVGFSMRNAMTDVMKLAATNPSALPAVFDTFISSWKTYGSEVIYAFKNNVQRRGTVEYLSNDDALLRLYNKGKRQWNEGKRAEGFKNMLFGMMEYVGRWLKALDEGAVSVLEQQGLTRYAMAAMKQAGISSKDANAAANYVQSQKQQFIVNAVAKGMNKTEAKALSDDVFRGAWIEALSNLKINSQEVLDSALNDSLSSIGRMQNTFDQLRQETRDIKDNGFVSSLPIGLLEKLGEAMNSPSATEGQRVFYRMVYGFAVVPARVMREAAWYSPYGFVRFAVDAFAKKIGKGSPYAQSLGTDLQFRQRLTETIAGSIVLGALMALSKGSTDDPEEKKGFNIVVTGNGPERRLDPSFHDTFFKRYSRNALHLEYDGKVIGKVNIERGFEAFAVPFMLAGAIDDWRIRRRFEQSKKTPSDLSDASILLGSAFLSFSRRGPFAAYMDGIISSRNSDEALTSLGSFLTFTTKTFVPIAGTSLARNISDFVSDPVDRRSMEGALWANTPVIGPMMGTKSMNALGETTGAGELSDRIYKLGMPIVFNLPGTPEQTKLRDLIIEKGQGPDIPTRYDARRALGFEPTDQQFERYVTAYGQYMKQRMLENYPSLKDKSPVKYVERLQVYQKTARLRAKEAVTKNISQP